MRLKLFTTTCLVFCVVLMLSYPWVIGPKPVPGPNEQLLLKTYATRIFVYVTIILICLFLTILGSYLILRQNRDEYRRQSLENLQSLLEATMKDHEKKGS